MRKYLKRGGVVVVAVLASIAAADGCVGYSTSRGRVDESIQKVYVEYLEDLTAEPNIGVDLTDAIIEAIQVDNTLKVVSEADADAIIDGRVTRYHLREMAPRQDLTVNEYQIQIAVMLSFNVRATGETIFKEKRFLGTGVYILDDPTGQTTEQTAKTEAGREIVKDILALVVADW